MLKYLQSMVTVVMVACVALLCSNTPVAAATRLTLNLTEEGVASLPRSLDGLLQESVVSDGTKNFQEGYLALSPDVLFVVTPGTEDLNLYTRLENLIGSNPVAIIEYDESFWPVMAGKSGAILPIFAPTFDVSRRQAVAQNLRVMRALRKDDLAPRVLYTGYSQGAVALGDAVEAAVAEGLLDEDDYVYLTSDGRGPWGILPRLQQLPFMELLLPLLGISLDGARNPADMDDVPVTDVIVTADSIANFQWKKDRVEESIFINILGYVVCHGDPVCYGDLEQHGPPTYYESVEGNVTYEVYHSLHPVTMLYLRICNLLQIPCGDTGTAVVEWLAQAWYEIDVPSAKGAAVPVQAPGQPIQPTTWPTPVRAQDGSVSEDDVSSSWSPPSKEDVRSDIPGGGEIVLPDDGESTTSPSKEEDFAPEITTPVRTPQVMTPEVVPESDPSETLPAEVAVEPIVSAEPPVSAAESEESIEPAVTQVATTDDTATPTETEEASNSPDNS